MLPAADSRRQNRSIFCCQETDDPHACKGSKKQIQIQSNRCTWRHFALFLLHQVHGLIRLASLAGLNRGNPRVPTPSLTCVVREVACFILLFPPSPSASVKRPTSFHRVARMKSLLCAQLQVAQVGLWERITTSVIRQTIYIFMRTKLV